MRLEPGPIPLYYRLQEHLQERILGNEFRSGDPLPTEEQLCSEYGVSRITVRRALDSLLQQDLISRRRGVGTFVADQAGPVKSIRLVGSLEETLSYAADLSYKTLSRKTVEPPPHVARALQLSPGARAVRIDVIGYLKGEAFAYTEFFFPEPVGALINDSDVVDHVPMLRAVEQKLGRRAKRAEQTVEPIVADSLTAKHLGIKVRAPILKVLRTYYTEANEAMEAALVRYHPERYRYTVQLLARS
jgi:GntR family transcriptional regulator